MHSRAVFRFFVYGFAAASLLYTPAPSFAQRGCPAFAIVDLSTIPPANMEYILKMQIYAPRCDRIVNHPGWSEDKKDQELDELYNRIFGTSTGRHSFSVPLPYDMVHLVSVAEKQLIPSEAELQKWLKDKEEWRRRWFHRAPDGSALVGNQHYHVIVASPCDEEAAQKAMRSFTLKYPAVYFELWHKAENTRNCHYAITIGIGLSQSEAKRLRSTSRELGMTGAYLWHW